MIRALGSNRELRRPEIVLCKSTTADINHGRETRLCPPGKTAHETLQDYNTRYAIVNYFM
jgi:hypothetical protein